MSEIVANLDAALADYRAAHAGVDRAIVLFGREWTLVPELTTTTASTLASVVSLANDPETGSGEQAMAALTAVSEVVPSVIEEAERDEFRAEWNSRGVPLGALEVIVEAVMQAFTTAPFSQAVPKTANEDGTPAPSSASGSSPTPSGAMSNPPSPVAPMPSPPAPPRVAGVTVGTAAPS